MKTILTELTPPESVAISLHVILTGKAPGSGAVFSAIYAIERPVTHKKYL